MVAEKIRSICQQHPSYRHSLGKHRARDFYDIYMIHSKNYHQPDFTKHIADIISDVFKAKAVPIDIITEGKIFDSKFITQQEHGFNAVRDAVDGKVQDFSFYVESMKLLVQDINRYH